MKKFILVETEVSKQTPFRHFSNLINLYNPNSIGVDPITPMEQQTVLFKHNRFNKDLFVDNKDGDLYLESFNYSKSLKIDLDLLTSICHSERSHHQWVGCGYVFSQTVDRGLDNIRFWYRDSDTLKIKDCFTDDEIQFALEQTITAARVIKETQGASIYGVADCAVYIMRQIMLDSGVTQTLGVLLPNGLENKLNCKELYISIPARLTKSGIHPQEDLVLDDDEWEKLALSAKIIGEVMS
jgi:hypothetical protein